MAESLTLSRFQFFLMHHGRAPMPPLRGFCDDHLRQATTQTMQTGNIADNQALLVNIWRKVETTEKRDRLREWLVRTWGLFRTATATIPICDRCGCGDNAERLYLLSKEGPSQLRDFALVLIRCSMNTTDTPSSWSADNITWWKRSGNKLQSLSRLKWLGAFMQSVVKIEERGREAYVPVVARIPDGVCGAVHANPETAPHMVFTLSIQPIIDPECEYDLYAVMK
jgi:hypothetical protein